MPEVMPGVHRIEIDYNGRPLKLTLLLGAQANVLLDAGDASTPDKDILPYFAKIGFDPKRLTHIIATHPDLDHTGGLARMHEVAPNALICCGDEDKEQCATPESLIDLRYRAHLYWHGLGVSDEAKPKILPRCGGPVPIHQTFKGGERIQLSADKHVEILHLPGHSYGHLGFYLPDENAAIIADAVHHRANFFSDGRAAFACTYMYVDLYLSTIDKLRLMKLDRLYSCHWPDLLSNNTINKWLDESRDYALHAEAAILDTLRAANDGGLTLREVCLQAKPKLGAWPVEKDLETRSMACGHLQRLVSRGLVRMTDDRPTRYIAEKEWRGLR